MHDPELQKQLTELVKSNVERNRENDVLREAARIVLRRTEANPGETTVRFSPKSTVRARITVEFYQP